MGWYQDLAQRYRATRGKLEDTDHFGKPRELDLVQTLAALFIVFPIEFTRALFKGYGKYLVYLLVAVLCIVVLSYWQKILHLFFYGTFE